MDDRVLDEAGTFMGVLASRELSNSKAALLGIPFDCGYHPTRIGARLGPQAIGQHSGLVRRFEPPFHDYDPLARLDLVDGGNVRVRPSFVAEAFENIEAAVWEIAQSGAVPVTMGGDGAVTLPQLRALHRRHRDLVVLHIDAHTDTYPDDGISKLPSRPGEFHPEPLTDPDLTLSRHPARATERRLPPPVENWSSSCCQLAHSQRR